VTDDENDGVASYWTRLFAL